MCSLTVSNPRCSKIRRRASTVSSLLLKIAMVAIRHSLAPSHSKVEASGPRRDILGVVSGPPFDHAVTLAIFTAAYVALGLGRVPGLRVDRTGVAIIAAAAMVVTGSLAWDDAVRSVDAHTLVLLFGMMIVAAYLR